MTSSFQSWCEEHLHKVRIAGKWADARCPLHEDHKPSLRVDIESGGYNCNSGSCPHPKGHLHQLASRAGLPKDGLPDRERKGSSKEVQAEFLYPAADGKPFGKIQRYWDADAADKGFWQMTWRDGKWVFGKDGKLFPIYRAPNIAAAPTGSIVLWLEGEKCVDQAVKLGFEATTSAQGAKGFSKCDKASLRLLAGRRVYVLPDNDKPGQEYARQVATALVGIAAEVHLVDLPGLSEKEDLVDWVQAGGTAEALQSILSASAPESADSNTPNLEPEVPFDWTAKPPTPLDNMPKDDVPCPRLPGILGEMVSAVAISLQVPLGMPTILGLATVASCIAHIVEVRLTPDWTEPASICAVPIAESGERKSPTIRAITEPIFDRQRLEMNRAKAENELLEMRRETLESELRLRGKDLSEHESLKLRQDLKELAPKPIPRRVCGDVTVEGLVKLISENKSRILNVSAEGTILSNLLGRYSQGGKSNTEAWLCANSGDDVTIDRKGDNGTPLTAPRALASTAITIQPCVIVGINKDHPEFREKGGFARCVWDVSTSKVGYRDLHPPHIPANVRAQYEAFLNRLMDIEVRIEEGLPKPEEIRLSHSAEFAFDSIREEAELLCRPQGGVLYMRDWINKWPGLISRFALVLHVVVEKHFIDSPISLDTMEYAISLGRYFLQQAKRAYYLAGVDQDKEDPAGSHLAKLLGKALEICDKTGTFSRTELRDQVRNRKRGRYSDDKVLDKDLLALVEDGWIRLIKSGPSGRPKVCYQVRPDAANLLECSPSSPKSQQSPTIIRFKPGEPRSPNVPQNVPQKVHARESGANFPTFNPPEFQDLPLEMSPPARKKVPL